MTDEAPRGRDVFVAGPDSAAAVAALFADAFGLPPARAVTADAPWQAQIDGLGGDHVVVYALEPDGDFPFKVAMDFGGPIPVERFAAMARAHGVRIAYAVDEEAANDARYHVVDRHGTAMRRLGFDETGDSYACTLLDGPP